jgi:mannose-6-phosphate isomerase-like protein (cupin superfamily)
MDATIRDVLSPQQLGEIARAHVQRPRDWIKRVRLDAAGRWYERIHASDRYDLWLISWLPGQATGFHDHGRSAGAFAVAWGFLEEHFNGTVGIVGTGTSRAFGPNFVHDVRNASQAPTVSLHVYSPPLTEMTRYDVTAEGLVARHTERVSHWRPNAQVVRRTERVSQW